MSNRAPHLAGPTPPNRFAPLALARPARLRSVIANLPDPGEQAYHLTEREHHALKTAWLTPTGWRVRVDYQAELGREGLCEVRGPFLTAFGMAVRRFVVREDA